MMPEVKCRSGLSGHQCNLRENYRNFEDFEVYSDTYGLASRLGYASAIEAWEANPVIQSSVIPSDFCRLDENGERMMLGVYDDE